MHSRAKKLSEFLSCLIQATSHELDFDEIEQQFGLSIWELNNLFAEFKLPKPEKVMSNLWTNSFLTNSAQLSMFDFFVDKTDSIKLKSPIKFSKSANFETIYYTNSTSFLGDIFIAFTEYGLCQLTFEAGENGLKRLKKSFPNATLIEEKNEISKIIEELFNRQREETIIVHLKCSAFQQKVWKQLISIPSNETKSYGEIATILGDANAARAVGAAVGANPLAVLIPCHRALAASGKIGKFRWGSELKRLLLALDV